MDSKVRTMTHEGIDWLSVTYPDGTKMSDIVMGNPIVRQIKSPIPVYDICYECGPYGYKILTSKHKRLGLHVIFSGKPLQALASDGITARHIYNVIRKNGGKLSRIDICFDVFDSDEVTVPRISSLVNEGAATLSMESGKEIGESGENQTLYLGSMKSRSRRFRIYNKQIEQNTSFKWVRFEYEKRRNADTLARRVMDDNIPISGIIKSIIDFPFWRQYQEIFDVEPTPIRRGQGLRLLYSDEREMELISNDIYDALKGFNRDLMNKLQWIEQSAIPAMLKALEIEYIQSGYNDDIIDNGIVAHTINNAMILGIRSLVTKYRNEK